MKIQHVNDNECMKVTLKIKVLSLLLIMNLQVIINNALCIMRKLAKQRNQRFTMTEKLNTML